VIRRVSFGFALALAALTTVACSSPTAPTAKTPSGVHADVIGDSATQTAKTGVQGAGF